MPELDNQHALLFFHKHEGALPLFEAFVEKILTMHPDTKLRIQKTQISFYARHLYACVSFLPVRKKAELPDLYLVVTLGLPEPLESWRVAAKTEPYSGRWTTHIVLGSVEEVDEELLGWVHQAYLFAGRK